MNIKDALAVIKPHLPIFQSELIMQAWQTLEDCGTQPASTNTGSPKLPLDIVETVLEGIFGNRYAAGSGAECVKQTITIIERQLRAGA